jgi:protein arginine kinase activator
MAQGQGTVRQARGIAAMGKCQKCPKTATLHITEVANYEVEEELHLCEDCAHKYLYGSQQGLTGKGASAEDEGDEREGASQQTCSACGLKFVEFRNSGRLGCPQDYETFRSDLLPLLENIHGETRHKGKVPRRLPESKQMQSELGQLRRQLSQAVSREAYEEAAGLRDRIRQLEES